MIIILALLALSLVPAIVYSIPIETQDRALNVRPGDIMKRETACIAKSNRGIFEHEIGSSDNSG